MKITILLLISICLNLTSGYSQTGDKQHELSSNEYLKIVYEQCAHPDIVEVESSNDGYIEVEYLCDGNRFEIGIKNNTLLFSESSVTQAEIPFDKIQGKLVKKKPGWDIDEFSKVTTKDTAFIKVEILKDGIEQNVYFTDDGKWFKMKPMDVSSTFDFSVIEKKSIYKSAKYDFNKPDSVYEMPDILREISGLELSKDDLVYCVQDELGAVFKYNLAQQKITDLRRFTDVGDFEDIAMNESTIYVLRSDGNLFIYDANNRNKTAQMMLQTNSLNIEGLFYSNGYLYIACKEALITQTENKRMIYRVPTDNLDKIEPFLELNLENLKDFITQNYSELGISGFTFNPSAVAIHPITKELYVLSASDRFMAIYRDKKLINVIPLSSEIYYKPEGLSFSDNGDLFISSEGDKKGFNKGTINVMKYE